MFYFDPYAYKNDENFLPALNVPVNEGLFEVESSFSGGVFYKYNKVIDLKYKFEKGTYEPICEHISFNRHIKMCINTNMKYSILSH